MSGDGAGWRGMAPPAVVVRAAAEVAAVRDAVGTRPAPRAADATGARDAGQGAAAPDAGPYAAAPALLLSAPGAAGFLGAAGWRALVDGAGLPDALCCGDAPGHALAALRAGCRILVLDGACPAFPAVAAAAAEAGAVLWPARPPALDLGGLDLRRPRGMALLAAWLAPAPFRPHDSDRAKG